MIDALLKFAVLLSVDLKKETYFEVSKISSLREPLVIQQVDKESCWINPMLKYLRSGELSSNCREAWKIRKQAARYVLYDDKLYKRSFSLPLLKYLYPSEVDYVLVEVHKKICRSHLRGRSLSYKILRQGYYWPIMQQDTSAFVRKYDRWQTNSNIPHQLVALLTPINTPWPFAQWCMDILDPFPLSLGQHKFLLVAIDYFTK